MRRFLPLLILAALATALATAPARAAGPAVTVYSGDLAFVKERRVLELRGARDTVRLDDVPERLDFASVRLDAGKGARVTRLAYRYDLASGDGLLEQARGQRVRVTLREDRVSEGTLLAADGGWLVLRADDGAVVTIARAAVDQVRLANALSDMRLRPTLEAVVEDAAKGRVDAELRYLTGGMSWSAEHVLERTGETTGRWSATVTIQNATGREYRDATLKLVAGEPRRAGPSPMPRAMMMKTAVAMEADGGAPQLSEETFSEYHLYTLDRPATLRDRETQSLPMLVTREVKFTPRYLVRPGMAVAAQLEFVNAKENGLGVPLAGGRVRTFEGDASGAGQFTGESAVKHVAEGEKFTVELGNAFDLAAERKTLAERRISDREREVDVEIELRNRKGTDVTFTVEEPAGGESQLVKTTHEPTRKDANTLEWKLPVKAKGSVVLRFTVRTRW